MGWMWLLPAAVGVTAAGILIWSNIERGRVRRDLDHVFEEHASSVARLIWESTREATEAIDTLYALTEDNLAARARLAANPDTDPGPGVTVAVIENRPGVFAGSWGPVSQGDRKAFIAAVFEAAPGVIVESGPVRRLRLSCLHARTPSRVIVCQPAERLARLRRTIGLGPLLREVARGSLRYAAIQDQSGILAASPGASLSAWRDDPKLAVVRDRRPDDGMVFRLVEAPGGALFEGLRPFPLPDGTTAVLRVGIDAAPMLAVQAGIDWRHQLLYVVMCVLLLVSVGGTWAMVRREERRRESERLLAAREEEQRHWQAIGQMASTVAHEVRNPLNTLKMAAQRLAREFEIGDDDRTDYEALVGVLGSEVDRVEAVVTEFLELGRPLVLERAAIPVARLVEEAAASLRLRAEQEDKKLEADAGVQETFALDRRRMVQVLVNLGGNALDAIEAGGTVAVRARLRQDGLVLDVEDDGPGMDATTREHAMHPFYTTKSRGTGLGLPLARRLIEAHGGSLTLEERTGGGTRATIFIPASPDQGGAR